MSSASWAVSMNLPAVWGLDREFDIVYFDRRAGEFRKSFYRIPKVIQPLLLGNAFVTHRGSSKSDYNEFVVECFHSHGAQLIVEWSTVHLRAVDE